MGLFFNKSLTVNECINRSRTEKNAVLLDIRTRENFKYKYISGSVNIPLADIDTLIPVRYKDKTVSFYVIGDYGSHPRDAIKKLKKMGYMNVFAGSAIEDHHGIMKHDIS